MTQPDHRPATMPALVKARPEPGIWLEQQPVPEPGPDRYSAGLDEVLVSEADILDGLAASLLAASAS